MGRVGLVDQRVGVDCCLPGQHRAAPFRGQADYAAQGGPRLIERRGGESWIIMGGGGKVRCLEEAIGGVRRNQHHDLHRDYIAGVDRDRRSGMQRAPSPIGAQRERIGIGGEAVVAQEVGVGVWFSRRDYLFVSRREGEPGVDLVSAQVRPPAPRP